MSMEKLGSPRAESGTYRLTRKLDEHTSGTTRRGRPPGIKRRTSIISDEDIQAYKNKVSKVVSSEELDYLLNVLEGKESSTLDKDLDIILNLNMKALVPILAQEAADGKLTSEGTRRVSAVKEMLNLKLQLSKAGKAEEVDKNDIIRQILNQREASPEHLAELIGVRTPSVDKVESSVLSGNVHADSGQTDEVRALSNQLLERQIEIPPRSEE